MTDRELAGCPFCGCGIYLVTNRDWHRLAGLHDDNCIFTGMNDATAPATDEQLAALISDWNRRTPSSEGDGAKSLGTGQSE